MPPQPLKSRKSLRGCVCFSAESCSLLSRYQAPRIQLDFNVAADPEIFSYDVFISEKKHCAAFQFESKESQSTSRRFTRGWRRGREVRAASRLEEETAAGALKSDAEQEGDAAAHSVQAQTAQAEQKFPL